jgi:hypothetical protein
VGVLPSRAAVSRMACRMTRLRSAWVEAGPWSYSRRKARTEPPQVRHVAHAALLVEVGEQFLPAQILALAHHPRDPPVGELDLAHLAALAAETEAEVISLDLHVVVAQGGQPEAVVVTRVLRVADPQQRPIHERHHPREHPLPDHAALAQVGRDPLAQGGQGVGEREQPLVLDHLPELAPLGVVAILLAPLGVPPRRLDVPVLVLADPHVGPGGRNAQSLAALPHLGLHRPAVARHVAEPLAPADPPDAGLLVRDVAQASLVRRPDAVVLQM